MQPLKTKNHFLQMRISAFHSRQRFDDSIPPRPGQMCLKVRQYRSVLVLNSLEENKANINRGAL